ncbi:MAG: hypothetical protein ABIA93_05955 [Candidatus Woesearchaeota archaeon]
MAFGDYVNGRPVKDYFHRIGERARRTGWGNRIETRLRNEVTDMDTPGSVGFITVEKAREFARDYKTEDGGINWTRGSVAKYACFATQISGLAPRISEEASKIIWGEENPQKLSRHAVYIGDTFALTKAAAIGVAIYAGVDHFSPPWWARMFGAAAPAVPSLLYTVQIWGRVRYHNHNPGKASFAPTSVLSPPISTIAWFAERVTRPLRQVFDESPTQQSQTLEDVLADMTQSNNT